MNHMADPDPYKQIVVGRRSTVSYQSIEQRATIIYLKHVTLKIAE